MDIAVCLDKNFVMPTGIMMTSVCENNMGEDLMFHVISADLTEEGLKDLKDITDKYGKGIRFYGIDSSLTGRLPIGQSWQSFHMQSIASYYRLFLSDILPEEVGKVIYLDGDIIVSGSLRGMWDTDMTGYGIAAVPDVLFCRDYHYARLGYPKSLGYCNAGVLLMNLKYWRDNDMEKACLDFVETSPEKIICHDQDVLNWVFRDRKLLLDLKYNVQQDFLYSRKHQKLTEEFYPQLDEAQKSPVIIHYIYGIKPWHLECLHPYRGEFLKYKSMTKWASQKPGRYFDGSCRKKNLTHRFLYWFKNSPSGRWAVRRVR